MVIRRRYNAKSPYPGMWSAEGRERICSVAAEYPSRGRKAKIWKTPGEMRKWKLSWETNCSNSNRRGLECWLKQSSPTGAIEERLERRGARL